MPSQEVFVGPNTYSQGIWKTRVYNPTNHIFDHCSVDLDRTANWCSPMSEKYEPVVLLDETVKASTGFLARKNVTCDI